MERWLAERQAPMVPNVAALRRALLAKGLTLKPTCEACRREVEPRDLAAGLCPPCKRSHDEASEWFQKLNDEADSTAPGVFATRSGYEPPRLQPAEYEGWPELDEEG